MPLSIANVPSELRKYRINLLLAHQYLSQLIRKYVMQLGVM
jgi:hypothetical protein